MPVVWDELKREANVAKHGFDFADFETSFDRDTALYLPAKPSRTGRERYLVVGDWNGETIVASSSPRSVARPCRSSVCAAPAQRKGEPLSTTDRKPEIPAPRHSQEDWDEVSDNPELTEEELAQLRPASEMPKHIFEALPKRSPGRPKAEAPKIHVKLRVDPAVVEAYKAGGPGWQTRMHEALVRGVEPEQKRSSK